MKVKEVLNLEQILITKSMGYLVVTYYPKDSKEHLEIYREELLGRDAFVVYNAWLESEYKV